MVLSKQITLLALSLLGALPMRPAGWTRVDAAKFEIFSAQSETRARAALKTLQDADAFFRTRGFDLHSSTPIRVIGLQSAEAYAAFSLHRNAFGHYFQTTDRDYIVVQDLDDCHLDVLVHEYTHFVLRRNGFNLPLWLNEGLADFYSSLQVADGHSRLGSPLPVRVRTLRSEPWIPLDQLVSAQRRSPLAESHAASSFYAESWAFVHMLSTVPQYSSHFPDLIRALSAAGDPRHAFSLAYGRTLRQMEIDLQLYVRNIDARSPETEFALQPQHTESHVRTISDFEIALLLADLSAAQPWTAEGADVQLRSLSELYPNVPQIEEMMGTLAYRRNRPSDALLHLRKAAALGSTDPAILYRLALLEQSSGATNPEVIERLEQVLALDPNHQEAAFQLAVLQFNERQFDKARASFSRIAKPSPAWASTYYALRAYCFVQEHNISDARSLAALAQGTARTAIDKQQADQLLARLNSLE